MAKRKYMTQEDTVPVHKKFGYKAEMEKAAIRERLIAAGFDPNSIGFSFQVEEEYIKAHRNDLTMRERQEIGYAKNWKPREDGALNFTIDELNYLAFKLDGVNDPEGYSAFLKIQGLLQSLNNQERPTLSDDLKRRAVTADLPLD